MKIRPIVYSVVSSLALCDTGLAYETPSLDFDFEPHHSSTAGEGWGRGSAAVVESWGKFLNDAGRAAINLEHARGLEARNWADAVRLRRQISDEYRQRAAQSRRPSTPEQLAKRAKVGVPQRPTAAQLSDSGKIFWPQILRTRESAPLRAQLDSLYEVRAVQGGGLGSENCTRIREEADKMLTMLKQKRAEMPLDEYLYARHFVESLSYEARFANLAKRLANR